MGKRVNLIVATAKNMGIGYNGNIPWRLKKDLALFASLTKTTIDKNKRNAVVMGRRTWESIPEKNRPLVNRLNVILTRNLNHSIPKHDSILTFQNLPEAISFIESREDIEDIWIIGGASVYAEAMSHPNCHRIYVTQVLENFECDVFMDPIDKEKFRLTRDPQVPEGEQEDEGLRFHVEVYEKIK